MTKSLNIDLHCHSTASDGTLSPTAVVELAALRNLSALALTDHDTIAGIAEAAEAAARLGVDFLPGIEISAAYPHPGTMHLLGYGIDPNSQSLAKGATELLAGRDTRNPKIIARLQELGVRITMDEVHAEAGGAVLGRPHIAAILLRKGYVSSIKQAFDKYLAPGGLAYFDKERLSPADAIALIRGAGGVAVLAHPIQLRAENNAQLERVLKDLVDLGLEGVETLHSDHDPAHTEYYQGLARRYNLLTTGGSDFHGSNKKEIDLGLAAGRRVPRSMYEALAERLANPVPAASASAPPASAAH